ncbi:MAG: D-2-hydroxyacid dehydrogenase [Spirochaetes bacterium]|nr:D-2-hydroxyacid dehydrogenase [Spirochaetota bacterium]
MSTSIVFLDASTVDFGDIDFTPIASLGNFITYSVTGPHETIQRSRDADIIITNKVVFYADEIAQLNRTKLIAVAATGYNTIDIKAAKNKNIAVANVPGYSREAVAQLTLCFILALATNLVKYNTATHDGSWSRSPIFTMGNWPTMCINDKVLGIMGFGDIGKRVAQLGEAFGMKVIALKRDNVSYSDTSVQRYALEEFCKMADFISIHMPLNDSTHHLINKDFLTKMKPTAYLINMARGPIVDTGALAWALHNNVIAGAALDVLEKEPPDSNDPILSAPNCIITPHIGWASRETRQALINEIAENIKAFLHGKKRNIVNDTV